MKKLVIATLLIAMISGVSAQSTGAAPSFQNLGDVRPGQTLRTTIYVTSQSYDQPYAVAPEIEAPLTSKILNPASSPLPVEQYSEESISGWVDFTRPTYTIDPTNSTPYVLSNGQSINANGEVTFNIRVPTDAEPGWHAGSVALNPQTDSAGVGYGAQTQTVSRPTFAFNVQSPENPERRLEVIDARGIRIGQNSARIDIRVANRGTVTTSVQRGNIDIYNRATGQKLGDLPVGYYQFEPSQSRVMSLTFNSENISQGSYVLNGTIDYSSSEAFIGQQTFALASQIQTNPEDPEEFNDNTGQEQESSEPSLWLMVLFVIVMSAIMYSFGFDFFWIIVAAGFIVIGLFIVASPVSNWLLLILLTTPVIILYYA